jgi:hypothetical protein
MFLMPIFPPVLFLTEVDVPPLKEVVFDVSASGEFSPVNGADASGPSPTKVG